MFVRRQRLDSSAAADRVDAGRPLLHRVPMVGPIGGLGRVAARLVPLEPLAVLALAPFLWFPRRGSGLLLLLVPLLWGARWATRGYLSVRTRYDLPLLCFALVLPLGLIPVVDWTLALPKLYSLLLGVALLYALANAIRTPSHLRGVVDLTVIFVGSSLAVVGLVGTEWTAGKLLPLDPIYARLPQLVHGVVYAQPRGGIHPNEIGGVLTLLLPLGLARLLSGRRWADNPPEPRSIDRTDQRALAHRLRRLVDLLRGPALIAASILMAAVLILTQSRSAYVGAVTGLVLVVAWWLRPGLGLRTTRPRVAVGGGLALLALGAGWLVWRLATSWVSAPGSGIESFPTRLELWSRALTILQDFPYTGVGAGQLSIVLHALYVPFLLSPDTYVPHAHNFFLQLGLDFGIPGAVAILGVLVGFFRSLWSPVRRADDRRLRAIAVGLGAGMVSFLVYGLTDAIALGARGGLVLWVVLGLAAALDQVTRPKGPQAPGTLGVSRRDAADAGAPADASVGAG